MIIYDEVKLINNKPEYQKFGVQDDLQKINTN